MSAIRDDDAVPLEINSSVRLPADLAERIDALAASWQPRLDRSKMIRVLVEEALDARESRPS